MARNNRKCFGLAGGYQLVGEVVAHQGDDGHPCNLKVGSQHQSIFHAHQGNTLKWLAAATPHRRGIQIRRHYVTGNSDD